LLLGTFTNGTDLEVHCVRKQRDVRQGARFGARRSQD
jgi:hypothetical protein